jgi:hypothetical protein
MADAVIFVIFNARELGEVPSHNEAFILMLFSHETYISREGSRPLKCVYGLLSIGTESMVRYVERIYKAIGEKTRKMMPMFLNWNLTIFLMVFFCRRDAGSCATWDQLGASARNELAR